MVIFDVGDIGDKMHQGKMYGWTKIIRAVLTIAIDIAVFMFTDQDPIGTFPC